MSRFRDFGPLPERAIWQGAAVLALDRRGRALMQLRDADEGVAAPAKWCCFGGGVEPGESVEAAARREFLEETGVDISSDVLIPLARFASTATKDGVLHLYRLERVLRPEDITLGEGAGFAFLTRDQLAKFDLISNLAEILADKYSF